MKSQADIEDDVKFWIDRAQVLKAERKALEAERDELRKRVAVLESDEFARSVIKRIVDTALQLAFTRHDLTSDEFDKDNYPDVEPGRGLELEAFITEIQNDTFNCLTGDDSGCLDPEDLDETNCELLWLKAALNPQDGA